MGNIKDLWGDARMREGLDAYLPSTGAPSAPSLEEDYWDEGGSRKRKYGPAKAQALTDNEINASRTRLFEDGSTFLRTTKEEIVGIDNVLVEIDQVIHWLKHSHEYQEYGSRLEPGVIFEGDPGTGKTLVSRYIATQSDAFFINVRDFAHAHSLFRDSDIKDLFERARARYDETGHPIVLFWDEFENGAAERGNASPEQAATVSQLTAELDGVHGKNEGVLLIGCTNYIYGIDAALRRSGRMGLHIEFNPPDRVGKRLLLKHYLDKYVTRREIELDTLSYFFDADATAADIEESCVEAWRHAVRRRIESGRGKPALGQEDLIKVFIKRLVGPPTTFINLPKEDRLRIAVHESGHAIMAAVYGIPLRLITVQPGKKSLGRVITHEVQEHIGTIDEMVSQMRVGIGSIVAERTVDYPAMVGSTSDLRSINQMAVRLVDSLYAGEKSSMFNIPAVASIRSNRGDTNPSISAEVVARSDKDVETFLQQTQADAVYTMNLIGRRNVLRIAEEVNDKTTLTGNEFIQIVKEATGQDSLRTFRGSAVEG